jgi:DNA polymerase eta
MCFNFFFFFFFIYRYREAGREVIEVLCQYSNCVERASIDEAYLDLTDAVEQRMLENPVLPSVDKLSSTFVVGYDDAIESEGKI